MLLILIGFVLAGADIQYTPEQESFINIVQRRRRVREYKSTTLPTERIQKMLDAAQEVAGGSGGV